VKSPAGLDIGARAPEEIALSILAEIVQVRRTASDEATASRSAALPTAAAREEIDPVCGMRVAVAGAKHTASAGGRDWYFCCGGCRERFLAAPERYTAAQTGIAGLGGTS
jgi:xanthine dehydrogenase accessory factor